jgi:hypothetical protein
MTVFVISEADKRARRDFGGFVSIIYTENYRKRQAKDVYSIFETKDVPPNRAIRSWLIFFPSFSTEGLLRG